MEEILKRRVKEAFDDTINSYRNILNVFMPKFTERLTERNLTFNFCHNYINRYSKDAQANIIVWQELPLKNLKEGHYKEHVDSLIIDKELDEEKVAVFFVEAKSIYNGGKVATRAKQIPFKDLGRMCEVCNPGEDKLYKMPELPIDTRPFENYQLIIFDVWKGKKDKCNEFIKRWEEQKNDMKSPVYSYSRGNIRSRMVDFGFEDIKEYKDKDKIGKDYYICYALYKLDKRQ